MFSGRYNEQKETFLVPLKPPIVNCFLLDLYKTSFVLNYTILSLITVHAVPKGTKFVLLLVK